MQPNGSRKGKGKATATAKMATSAITQYLLLDQDRILRFISQPMHGLKRIYNVGGVIDERAWDLVYHIIVLDPVTTGHF